MNIRQVKKDDIILIKKGAYLRRVDTTLRVTEADMICNRRVKVKRVNKTSLQIVFIRETYRMQFKMNPEVEIIEPIKI